MEVKVTYRNGMQFAAEARGHVVVCDQPVEAGGADAGMTPPEFLLASLGTCVMYYAANYFRMHKLSAEGMTVTVEADKAMNPPRLGAFRLQLHMPDGTPPQHQEGARRSAEKCLIKNTLLAPPEISLRVEALEAVA